MFIRPLILCLLITVPNPLRATEYQSPSASTSQPVAKGAKAKTELVVPVPTSQLPEQLPGVWKVSLCAKKGHTWIRFENQTTKEVRTLGRFARGVGGKWNRETRSWDWRPAPVSGVLMDMELRHEPSIKKGYYILLSVYAKDPKIFRGINNGVGHHGIRNNCVTYARDAWHFYSNEWYNLPPIHTPASLRKRVIKYHDKKSEAEARANVVTSAP